LRTSSRVTPSLLNSPPWTTKYLLSPSGDSIVVVLVLVGAFVAFTSVASGTEEPAINQPNLADPDIRTSGENVSE
jgi:hypothetical protein